MRFSPKTPDQIAVFQSGFLTDLQRSGALILPTGGGKTQLSKVALLYAVEQRGKAIYLAPTKAVLLEQFERWKAEIEAAIAALEPSLFDWVMEPLREYEIEFSDELIAALVVNVFDGDHQPAAGKGYAQSQILLMTPERLDLCLRSPSVWSPRSWIKQVRVCVIDEVQSLGDGHRGARLEGALVRLRQANPECRWIALSASLNPDDVALLDWIGEYRYSSTVRPIPLDWQVVRYRSNSDKQQRLLEILQQPMRTLIFCQSRNRTQAIALMLKERGIAADFHHAGRSVAEKQAVETAFREQEIEVIVATSTLAVGVNFPVQRVVIYDLMKPRERAIGDSFQGRFEMLPPEVVMQLGGRAGRLGLDTAGLVVVMAHQSDRVEHLIPNDDAPPVRALIQSQLGQPSWLLEQIMAWINGGYAHSQAEIQALIDATLAARQGKVKDTAGLESMLTLLTTTNLIADGVEGYRTTKLGQQSAQHYLMPRITVQFSQMIQACLEQPLPLFIDWLAFIASTEADRWLGDEVPCWSEELAQLQLESRWLVIGAEGWSLIPPFTKLLGVESGGSRLAKLYRQAQILRMWTRCGNLQEVCDGLKEQGISLYLTDVLKTIEQTERLLEALLDIAAAISVALVDESSQIKAVIGKLQVLKQMITTGCDGDLVSLTLLKGIGAKRARLLAQLEIDRLDQVAKAEVTTLEQVKGITTSKARELIEQARELMDQVSLSWFSDEKD